MLSGKGETHSRDPDGGLINPTLLLEVTSRSTEKRDRGVKLDDYRLIASLRQYVIASHLREELEVWSGVDPLDASRFHGGGYGGTQRRGHLRGPTPRAVIHKQCSSIPGEELSLGDDQTQPRELDVLHSAEAIVAEALGTESGDHPNEFCVGIREDDAVDRSDA